MIIDNLSLPILPKTLQYFDYVQYIHLNARPCDAPETPNPPSLKRYTFLPVEVYI